MCGIVGAIAQRDVSKILIEGLKCLEYRGYDSAGIALLHDGELIRVRTQGKVKRLEERLEQSPIRGSLGIAHTRWATHGAPSESNAHPHMSDNQIALVHNGIIENHATLRDQLKKLGYQFTSETDTEIVAHLLHAALKKQPNLLKAIQETVSQLEGAFALAIIHADYPDQIYAVRCGSPIVVGLGIGENFLASDQLALLPVTQRFIVLEEGDIACIEREKVTIYDHQHQAVSRPIKESKQSHVLNGRGEYRHYMEKEIFEQADAIQNTMAGRFNQHRVLDELIGERAPQILEATQRIHLVACGTSYHAGLVAAYWLETFAGIPCRVEIASEYRYRNVVVEENTLFITISQSGETADTLAALRVAKQKNYLATLAICNVPESSLARESELIFMTHAGVEIGVASTKAFTAQLTVLLLLTLAMARYRQRLTDHQETEMIAALQTLPKYIDDILQFNESIKTVAQLFLGKQHALFLGRGLHYPIALEGALKLKELSYIHAEAYPAGELKHGPLALIDKDMMIVALAPQDEYQDKLSSNLSEVQARGGQFVIFADPHFHFTQDPTVKIIRLPEVPAILSPILYTLPLQLLAYHVAVLKGTDVDQPRNLAKSVTVE